MWFTVEDDDEQVNKEIWERIKKSESTLLGAINEENLARGIKWEIDLNLGVKETYKEGKKLAGLINEIMGV